MVSDEEFFWVKMHHSPTGEVILAACDKGLLGSSIKISDGFSVRIKEEFYMGHKADWSQLLRLIESATIINLVGEELISKAIEAGIISKEAIITIGGVKHVQIMK